MHRKVAVIGVGYTTYGNVLSETREKSQIAFAAVKSALDMSKLSIEDIEATFFCSVDGFEGTNRIDRTIDAYGQRYNRPVIMVNTGGTGGASGFKDAYHYIAAGIYDIVLVYGSSTAGEVADGQQVLNTATPPLFEKPFGLGAIGVAAFNCTRYMHEYGVTEYDFALVAARSFKYGAQNPYAHVRKGYSVEAVLNSPMIGWPLRRYEICPISSGASAIILASADKAKELSDTPVWIRAAGSLTDTFQSGYRDYQRFWELRSLCQKLYPAAGIKDPLKEIDVAEVFNPFSPFELMACEGLGFCDEGKGMNLIREGITDIGGELPVNMSGGTLCTNSGISSSLNRIGDVALQLMGKFEGVQVKSPEIGLAQAWGGNLGQFNVVTILSR